MKLPSVASPGAARFAPALLTLGLLFLAACNLGTRTADTKGGDSRPTSGPEGTAALGASPFERPLAITPERTLTYANLRFAVTKGIISNRTPDDSRPQGSNLAVADVTLTIVNASKAVVKIENALWQLKLGDGTVYKQPFSERLEPRNTHEQRISFRVPMTAQWTGASLILDEKDKEPATVSLDGPVLPSPYPSQLATGGEATTEGPAMQYTILAANQDLDGAGERAALGKRYLHLSVRVTDKESGLADAYLPEFFRFSIDGAPYAPELTSDNSVIKPQSSQDVTMSLLIPATATSLELEVGKPDIQKTIKIPLDLKGVKAS